MKSKYSKLCSELTALVNDHLLSYSQELRKKHVQITNEYLDDVLGGRLGLAGYILKRFRGYYLKSLEQSQAYSESFFYIIENSSHANDALSFFKEDDLNTKNVLEIFKAKLKQLTELESIMENDPTASSLATIEPDSIFAITYVLEFPRSLIDSKRYNIDIEAVYTEYGKSEKNVGAATTSLIISPKPYILTLIAILGSLLGVLLKVAIEPTSRDSPYFYQSTLHTLVGSVGISAVILAIIFYNVYEFTDIGKNIKINIGWRSALLIGALCGLLGDRILSAIQSFLNP